MFSKKYSVTVYCDVGRQGVEIYPCTKFCLSQCFPLSVTYAIENVLAKTVFFVVFQEIQCLHNFNHDDVHHVTELYLSTSFMFVSTVVSEIHDLNQNKKETKNFVI